MWNCCTLRMSFDKRILRFCKPQCCSTANKNQGKRMRTLPLWRTDFACCGWPCFFQYCLNWAEVDMAAFLWSHSHCHWELAGINVLRNKSLFCFDIRRLFSCDTALAQCISAAFGHCHCWVSLQSCCNAVIVNLRRRKSRVIALATILNWFCLRCYNIPALIRSVGVLLQT